MTTTNLHRLLRIFLNGPPVEEWDPQPCVLHFMSDRRCVQGAGRGPNKEKGKAEEEAAMDTSEISNVMVARFASEWDKWKAMIDVGGCKKKKRKGKRQKVAVEDKGVGDDTATGTGVDMGVGPDSDHVPTGVSKGVQMGLPFGHLDTGSDTDSGSDSVYSPAVSSSSGDNIDTNWTSSS